MEERPLLEEWRGDAFLQVLDEYAERKDLSRKDVGEKLAETEYTFGPETIAYIEGAEQEPDLNFYHLARALGEVLDLGPREEGRLLVAYTFNADPVTETF
jgi:hypothetical protein